MNTRSGLAAGAIGLAVIGVIVGCSGRFPGPVPASQRARSVLVAVASMTSEGEGTMLRWRSTRNRTASLKATRSGAGADPRCHIPATVSASQVPAFGSQRLSLFHVSP